jgi:hypothetical protein
MANTQLNGRTFNYEGHCYLIVEDNDWEGAELKVKRLDGTRAQTSLPTENVMRCVFPQRPDDL